MYKRGGSRTGGSLMRAENIGYFFIGFLGWGIAYFLRALAATKVKNFGFMLLMATAGK